MLESLVGKVSYQQIAIKLGRPAQGVQKRASEKGFSARRAWRQDKAMREAQQSGRLLASEEELSQYL